MEWQIHRVGKTAILIGTTNGAETFRDSFHPDREASRSRVCRKAGISEAALLAALSSGSAVITPPTKPASCRVFIRGLREPAVSAMEIPGATFADALSTALGITPLATDPIIFWSSGEEIAGLDVDFHHLPMDQRPDLTELECAAVRLRPIPAMSWATHGRGLRAIYFRGTANADELAACAAVGLRAVYPEAGLQIVTSTRHPGKPRSDGATAGPVWRHGQSGDLGVVGSWFSRAADRSAVDGWLAEQGMEMGRRYPHSTCPVAPAHESHGDPVYITERGVYCHSCAGNGVLRGARTPGFFPWHVLIPGAAPAVVETMIRCLTHWEHARFVIEDSLNVRGQLAELAYRAALKAVHGEDPRVQAVFHAGKDLIRRDGFWSSADGSRAWSRAIAPVLSSLPAVQFVYDGEVRASGELVNRFQERIDLTDYGYPAVYPIRGLRIYSHAMPLTGNRITAVMQGSEYDDAEDCVPRYVPIGRRMPLDEAWGYIESVFPGVDRAYLTLLLAAKGAAEGCYGDSPRILCSGPAGSGKTQTTLLAASIAGDRVTAVPWTPHLDRFRAALADGAECGDYVQIDEIFKAAKENNKTGPDVLNAFLTLTPESVSHKLYVGPVPMGRLPVIVVTDTHVPQSVRADLQIGRRFVTVRLPGRVHWTKTMSAAGVHQIGRFRLTRTLSGEPLAANAGNAVLSDLIDRFFRSPRTFQEIASDLGFRLLEEEPGREERKAILRAFFDAVCAAPEPTGRDKQRWSGPGWKIIRRHGDSDLVSLWCELCDDLNAGFVSSRVCDETTWKEIIGTHAVIDIRSNGGSCVAVRFRGGSKFNAELLA